MEHSIALVTGTPSGLDYGAARTLAGKGWREIIITGLSLSRTQEKVAQLAAETNPDLHAAGSGSGRSVQSALAALVRRLPTGMAV